MSDLLNTLKRAHEAAQSIPELEIELREVLAGMGYTLGKLSPFVEPEPAVETPQDMDDWRNWREGDLILDINSPLRQILPIVSMEPPTYRGKAPVALKGRGGVPYRPAIYQLLFHSRPAKGEE